MQSASRKAWSPPAVEDYDSMQLSQVHIFFRHGDRSPTPLGDDNAKARIWESRIQDMPTGFVQVEYVPQPEPWGQLTKKGAEEAKALGEWIKKHYLSALNGSAPQILQVRSTRFQRTHLTGWYVLEGLLGSPEAAATIPISIKGLREENLYHNNYCPRLAKLWKAALHAARNEVGVDGDMTSNWQIRYKGMQAAMATYLGLTEKVEYREMEKITSFPWLTAVDAMECSRHHGDPLPEGVSDAQIAEVRDIFAYHYVQSFQDREILQLGIGRLVKEIVNAMSKSVESPSHDSKSLFLYSGHDATLVPLSVALGVPWKGWPAYTASMCIELWQNSSNGRQFVRVLYDGKEVALPLSLEKGEIERKSFLELEEFEELAQWTSIQDSVFEDLC